jgi:hypothetical protein
MNKFLSIVLLACLSLSASGQANKDRNLVASRKHSDVTTLPPQVRTGESRQNVNSQLDKLERQTTNTVVQPAAKSPRTPANKLPPDTPPATGTAYQQTMPVHAATKNSASSASRSSRPSVNPYKR